MDGTPARHTTVLKCNTHKKSRLQSSDRRVQLLTSIKQYSMSKYSVNHGSLHSQRGEKPYCAGVADTGRSAVNQPAFIQHLIP